MHSFAYSEAGFDFGVVTETDVLVGSQRVRIRGDLDAQDVFPGGYSHDVLEQVATDSAPHPIRVDEQVFQFQDPVCTKRGRKANDVIPYRPSWTWRRGGGP